MVVSNDPPPIRGSNTAKSENAVRGGNSPEEATLPLRSLVLSESFRLLSGPSRKWGLDGVTHAVNPMNHQVVQVMGHDKDPANHGYSWN